jgi:hypothetical protein
MKKLFLVLYIILFFSIIILSCEDTTNSMIYTGFSNILTYVYITEYGSSYHAHDCYLIKGFKTTYIKRTEAEARGYKPCSVCFY